jgi:hypothetical protein
MLLPVEHPRLVTMVKPGTESNGGVHHWQLIRVPALMTSGGRQVGSTSNSVIGWGFVLIGHQFFGWF